MFPCLLGLPSRLSTRLAGTTILEPLTAYKSPSISIPNEILPPNILEAVSPSPTEPEVNPAVIPPSTENQYGGNCHREFI